MSETSGDHAALEVVDLHKSFADVEVIRGVSLQAHKGDVISILALPDPVRVPSCAVLTCLKSPLPAKCL